MYTERTEWVQKRRDWGDKRTDWTRPDTNHCFRGNSKPCYRGVTVIKRTKLSRSKAEQDGQQQDKPDRAKKLSQHGRKQQNTGLCEGDGERDKDSTGKLCAVVGECWDKGANVHVRPKTSVEARDCPDLLMSSSRWRWDIRNKELMGPSWRQVGNIVQLCCQNYGSGCVAWNWFWPVSVGFLQCMARKDTE